MSAMPCLLNLAAGDHPLLPYRLTTGKIDRGDHGAVAVSTTRMMCVHDPTNNKRCATSCPVRIRSFDLFADDESGTEC